MKNTIKIFGIIALVALIVIGMAGCPKKEQAPVSSDADASIVETTVDFDSLIADFEAFAGEYVAFFQGPPNEEEADAVQAKWDEWLAQWEEYAEDLTEEQNEKVQEIIGNATAALASEAE